MKVQPMYPLRFISEALGKKVEWDEATMKPFGSATIQIMWLQLTKAEL